MSFEAKEIRETKIKADRRPRISLCGDCGDEISETELLCAECRKPRPEDVNDLSTLQTSAA
jgi:predicted amidophosphoribosyltransferase